MIETTDSPSPVRHSCLARRSGDRVRLSVGRTDPVETSRTTSAMARCASRLVPRSVRLLWRYFPVSGSRPTLTTSSQQFRGEGHRRRPAVVEASAPISGRSSGPADYDSVARRRCGLAQVGSLSCATKASGLRAMYERRRIGRLTGRTPSRPSSRSRV
jgi:hypothetical protein